MSVKTYPLKCAIRAQDDGVTRVDVYDDIGPGGWFSDGLTAKDFTGKMAGITGPVECHVNSGGGDVFDGIAIANALRAHKAGVTVVVDGLAASIASVIAQAGAARVMQANSMMMIHDAFGMATGNAAEMRQMADTLDKVSDNIADVYASRSGQGDAASWRDTMKGEAWYTADEAVAAGLADRVGEGAASLPAGLDVEAFAGVPGRIAAALRSMPQAAAQAPVLSTTTPPGPSDGGALPPEPAATVTVLRAAGPRRVLGLESMPLADKALPVHHTATEDKPWNGPAAVAAMPADDTVLKYCFAWESEEAAAVPHREDDDDADDQKQNYKFPHHEDKGGPANVNACSNGLARLPGAGIPDADRAGVEAHLRAHLKDAGHGDEDAEDSTDKSVFSQRLKQMRAALPALKGADE